MSGFTTHQGNPGSVSRRFKDGSSSFTLTHTHTGSHVLTSILPGGSELTLYTPSLHVLVSINHRTKQMSGTKEGSPGLWGEGGAGGGGGRKEGRMVL